MEVLRVGIAGYGVVGERRRLYVDAHPAMVVRAVCDKSFVCDGVMEDGVSFYPDYQSMMAGTPLDVLFVCMPNFLAAEVTIAGLEAGMHVFCEKPPGRDIEDIVKVIEMQKKCPDQVLKYGFNHRYHHSIQDALDVVESGELGKVINLRGVYGKSKIISFDSTWRTERELAGGGILLDQGIHMVDMMRLFAGEFSTVYSIISNDYWQHDVEDNAYALMKTESGIVAMLQSSATQWRHRFHLVITLAKGQLILEGILSGSKSYGAEMLTIVYAGKDDNGDPFERTNRYNDDPSWELEIEEFANAIVSGEEITNGSSFDALMTVKLVYQIYCADSDWKSRFNLDDELPGNFSV